MDMSESEYYREYRELNFLGLERGERPFLYSFWLRRFRRLLNKGDSVCEAGIGLGHFFLRLKKTYKAAGFDISETSVKEVRERGGNFLARASAENIPFKTGNFSAVVAFDILEHLHNPEALIAEAYRILGHSGYFVLSTPNPESLGARIKTKKKQGGGRSHEVWFGLRDATHVSIRKMGDWRELLRRSDFEIVRDGTDMCWDVPYFRGIPVILQKLMFIPSYWIVSWSFGFLPWKLGENYICIARKRDCR